VLVVVSCRLISVESGWHTKVRILYVICGTMKLFISYDVQVEQLGGTMPAADRTMGSHCGAYIFYT